ncbi:MAG: glycosyltransferase [Bacteriovoracaceae bacterium]|nr:glycosyltransferase [Bacteriovoracaceae bacterium]
MNHISEYGFRRNFLKLGHEVQPFYYDSYLSNIPLLQKDLIKTADHFKPDLIFFMLFQDQFSFDTLSYLKKKYKTINWFGDDTWRFSSFTKKYAPYFSYSITTDKYSIENYKEIGISHVLQSQWAALDEYAIPKFKGKYEYDISFVGGYHPYRDWILKRLKKKGFNVACYGHGWPAGSLSGEEMSLLFRHSKINLNLSNSVGRDARFIFSHPKNLIYSLKSSKKYEQIKARNFEIPYYGGFQLTSFALGLEDYFDLGKEIAVFGNADEVDILISYYLKNEQEREAIRNLGHQRAIREHGYLQRLKLILSELNI